MDEQGHHKSLNEGEQDGSLEDGSRTRERNSKGKGKEPTMLDRFRSSAKGASEAMTSGDAGLQGISPSSSKATAAGSGVSRDTAGILQQTSLNRSSRSAGARGVDTFRESWDPDGSSQAFD